MPASSLAAELARSVPGLPSVRLGRSAGTTERAGARAVTVGDTVSVTDRSRPAPATRRLFAHEIVHVAQQTLPDRRRSPFGIAAPDAAEREAQALAPALAAGTPVTPRLRVPPGVPQYGGEDDVCLPDDPGAPKSTFVLDPALRQGAPDHVTTHVRVASGDGAGPDRYLEIDRPVLASSRIVLHAVPRSAVYDDPCSAAEAVASDPTRSSYLRVGEQAWTASGGLTVDGVTPDAVLTADPTPDATVAATVITMQVPDALVLLDVGLRGGDPVLADAIAEHVAYLLSTTSGAGPVIVHEAVLLPGASQGHLLPYLARHVIVGQVRSTVDEFADESASQARSAVQEAQDAFRERLRAGLRADLEIQRQAWEATQPIALTRAGLEQRWQRHAEQEVEATLAALPPTTTGGVVEHGPDWFDLPAEPGAVNGVPGPGEDFVDLGDLEWQPAPAGVLALIDGDRLHLLDAQAVLLVPRPRLHDVTTPGLRGRGPTGPVPVGARAPTPWLGTPAIAKGAFVLARSRHGIGFAIDAGGSPALLTGTAVQNLMTTMGVSAIDGIVVTHGHADHVNRILDLVTAHDIPAEQLVLSRSWVGMRGPLRRVIDALRQTDNRRLLDLGYGPDWEPGVAMEGTRVTEATVTVGGGRRVRVLARGEVQTGFREGGHPGHLVDPASLLYVLGNETSGHRTLVLGDVRGTDIRRFHEEMGAERFRAAVRGVRVVVGFGHHFSDVAGGSGVDVIGLELLFRELVVQNGELTIVIQSTSDFSFGRDPLSAQGRALLEFCTRLGARVVFADRPAASGTGTGLLQSDLTLSLTGTGLNQFSAEPRVAAALERLQMLRDAGRTLTENLDLGRRFLRSSAPAAELTAGLNAEIAALESALNDLIGRAGADLYNQRAGATEPSRRAFRAERETSGRSMEDIYAELARRGPVESAIPGDVERGLRAAVRHGSTLSVEAELLSTPRAATEAVSELPAARRQALERQYRTLAEAGAGLTGENVPAGRRAELMAHVQLLRTELLAALGEAEPARRGLLEAEVRRFDGVLEALGRGAEAREVQVRSPDGSVARTEYRLVPRQDVVDRAFGRLGQGFGALMIYHSFHGLAATATGLGTGEQTVPESLLRTVHDAWGLHAGVRMLTLRHVGMGEFVALAVIEFGAVLAADHATTEQRDFMLARTALHSTVNLICMRLGMGITTWGASLPNPYVKGAVMGLGLAVTLAGEPLLNLLSLDDNLERWTAFAPSEVTEVYQEIDATLEEYRMAIGSQALARRDLASLTAAGAGSPANLRAAAGRAAEQHRSRARRSEQELVSLFEVAYGRARTSYVGLQALDALAERFAVLRHAALGNDPAHQGLQRRFLQIDSTLGLDGMSPTAVRAMEQWSELNGKLTEVSSSLAESAPDWSAVFERLDEARQMLDNARYRIDPARAGHRGTPLISPRSPAWGAYVEKLDAADQRLARILRRATELSGSPEMPVSTNDPSFAGLASGDAGPRAALARLQSVREAYDDRVREASAALPELAESRTWADPAALASRSTQAHRDHPQVFRRLRLAEVVLHMALGQARSSTRTARAADPTVVALIERDSTAAEQAIDARRVTHGMLLPNEVDAELVRRHALEGGRLSAAIDEAFGRQGEPGAPTQPLTPEELAALHHGELTSWGGRISTTEQQLTKAWDLLAPIRTMRLTDPMIDPFADDYLSQWNALDRAERKLARVVGPTFWTLDTDWIDTTDEHSLRPDEDLIVVHLPGHAELATKHWYSLSSTGFVRVLPVSPEAVTRLGRRPVYIAASDLSYLTAGELNAAGAAPAR
jgi:hypothetical protein